MVTRCLIARPLRGPEPVGGVGFSRFLRYCEGTKTRAGNTMRWAEEAPMGMHVQTAVRGDRRALAPSVATQWRVTNHRHD